MALGKRRREEDENEIDMTPMLDVVFIMLIFFIVTASFVNESGLGVSRPPVSDQPPPDTANTNIVFRVSESNELTLQGRRIDIRAVRANVERMHAGKSPKRKWLLVLTRNLRPSCLLKFLTKLAKPVSMIYRWPPTNNVTRCSTALKALG